MDGPLFARPNVDETTLHNIAYAYTQYVYTQRNLSKQRMGILCVQKCQLFPELSSFFKFHNF